MNGYIPELLKRVERVEQQIEALPKKTSADHDIEALLVKIMELEECKRLLPLFQKIQDSIEKLEKAQLKWEEDGESFATQWTALEAKVKDLDQKAASLKMVEKLDETLKKLSEKLELQEIASKEQRKTASWGLGLSLLALVAAVATLLMRWLS